MTQQLQPLQHEPDEISGVLRPVYRLGQATEKLFNRLYRGIAQSPEQQALEKQLRIRGKQNLHLRNLLEERNLELEQLHAILASIDEGVIMLNLKGHLTLINEPAMRLLGTEKNFWGSALGALFDAHKHVTVFSSELTPLGETEQIQVNDQTLHAQLAAIADRNGDRIGTVIILRNIQQDSQVEQLKDSLMNSVSHELKTPLSVIKMASDALSSLPEDAPANRRLLDTLGRNVELLNRMVVELIDISKIYEDSLILNTTSVDITTLVQDLVERWGNEIQRASMDVFVWIKQAEQLILEGDETRLNWALDHLIRNSIQYSEAGQKIIITAKLEVQKNNEVIIIEVIDQGTGIADTDLPHIFEQFYRGHAINRDGKRIDPRGLGQGLFIARTVLEAHGGTLDVKSRQGEGSTFRLVLPVEQPLALQ